jgi:hypothetical protein
MRPATLLLHDVGNLGAANRILLLNRVLCVIARIYRAHIKNSPPIYDLADEAQWVATIFR